MAAGLAPDPAAGPFWFPPFVRGSEEEEWRVTKQPCMSGAAGDLQLSSLGQLCPVLRRDEGQ